MEDRSQGFGVMPSTTGNYPREHLRRGRSLLGREEDQHESGLALFKRSATLRRKRPSGLTPIPSNTPDVPKKRGCWRGPGPGGPWMTYCLIITFLVPPAFMRACGLRSPEQQRAWREKMGLISLILVLMAGVGFLTFGFTESVCGTPPNRFHGGAIGDGFIGNSSLVINGYDYDFSKFKHPAAGSTFDGDSNPVLDGSWNAAGNDASFLFQKVNEKCLGIVTKSSSSSISGSGSALNWYFPCNIYSQFGNQGANITGYETSFSCHTTSNARNLFNSMKPMGQVYYTWDDVHNTKRNLAVYESYVVFYFSPVQVFTVTASSVLDLNKLNWLSRAQVNYPTLFDDMKSPNGTYDGKDLTMLFVRTGQQHIGHCLQDLVTVGFIDTNSIGCVASSVVLYLSLIFIIGVVAIRFVMAVMFAWFFSWRIGNFPRETYEQRMQRSAEIESWSNDIYRPAPSEYRPNVNKNGIGHREKRKTFLPSHSRFTPADNILLKPGQRPSTQYGMLDSSTAANWKRSTMYSSTGKLGRGTPPESPAYRQSRSTMSLAESPCPWPLLNVVPQPPPDYEPFNFPLVHTMCLVTAYSESLLKTFPKRKNMFCPQAVCKTIVPDTFRILLSQRRRWINSTIHNLAELVLVRDLCGTFCFSMQFVVGMELAGTLVLPAAIAFTLYLIVSSIIPGGPNTTIPLILLAIVLGLPGVLIVVTSRKIAYVGWMIVYLISLPIWNGILPAYAFWHFDDFSWGQTRKVEGADKAETGDKEGEFDSTHIVMKRWAEFERERRWKNGTQSRDSANYEKKYILYSFSNWSVANCHL
ncbi:hypothetical protein C0993_005505 [Termitomyces sp. T159_Od127]|nr:hypothetical protein C0993_005505 [Termitomyces sp. T159_Od127]